MAITEQIEEIIKRRKDRLPVIQKKQQEMEKIRSVLAELEYMKDQMIDSEGSIRENGRYSDLLRQNPDMAWKLQGLKVLSCQEAVRRTESVLEESRKRFSRDYISISVIGEARRGKSALLKSISGLSDFVIPAFESTDCTGAPSIIYNQSGSRLQAKLTFKSRKQMRHMAQVYLDRIISDEQKQIHLSCMEDIKHLDMEEVLKRANKGDPDGIYRRYLSKMVEHYEDWAEYAGMEEPKILYEEKEIASFVAQNNGIPAGIQGREDYYKYLVVESCEITCSFPHQDVGKISLIDTVGLGDHTLGILETMLSAVAEKSDAVIFMIMPQNGAGGGIPQSVKEIYSQIVENCRDKKLDKWLFYLINHVERPNKVYAVNTAFCESAIHMLHNAEYFGNENARVVNALDEDAVRDKFLVPLLEKLTENLDEIDQIYMNQLEECLKKTGMEYHALCTKVQKVLQSDISRNAGMIPLINRLTAESKEKLRAELFGLMNQWLEKRNQPCPVIYNSASDILDRMTQDMRKDSYLPTLDQIYEQLNTGIQPSTLYTQYANQIRNAISRDFLNVNVQLKHVIDEMKNSVADVLCEKCGLNVLYAPAEDRPLYEWMEGFSEHILGEDNTYENIKLAVDTLINFEFSVKGFLTYEVRNCLDELDPRLANIPALVSRNNRLKNTAGNIRIQLLQRLCDIADVLERVMRELCIKPNRALFAEVIEFYDRMVYAEGVDMEWNNFYAEKAGILWRDEIKQIQNVSILCQDWIDMADRMQKLNHNAAFCIPKNAETLPAAGFQY